MDKEQRLKSINAKLQEKLAQKLSQLQKEPVQKVQRTVQSKGEKIEAKIQRKKEQKSRAIRKAAGEVWEDKSMLDWPENDFRIYCGNLGKEVTDDMLTKSFMRYKSFAMARVIRDKLSGRSRGFGFISLRSSQDFLKALKQMQGAYVGTQPIKLKKSNWQERQYDPQHKSILGQDFSHFRKKKQNENSKFIYACRY